jgi:hypothetical protein
MMRPGCWNALLQCGVNCRGSGAVDLFAHSDNHRSARDGLAAVPAHCMVVAGGS